MASSDVFSPAVNRRMGIGMIMLGVVLALLGACFGARQLVFYHQSVGAVGTVLDVGPARPLVGFRTAAGRDVTLQALNRDRDARVGDKVDVVYLEEQPDRARLNLFMELWGWPLITCLAGLVIVVTGDQTLKGRVLWGPRH